jgi:hypothetical protein
VRVRAGLALEVGDDPNGQAPPVSERRREGGRRQAAREKLGQGKLLGRAGGERESGPGQLGHAGGGGKAGLGQAIGEKKRKIKRESGPGPIRKRERKRIAFKCI